MGPPKAKEKDISRRIFYTLFSPGFEPGTSRRGKKSIFLTLSVPTYFLMLIYRGMAFLPPPRKGYQKIILPGQDSYLSHLVQRQR